MLLYKRILYYVYSYIIEFITVLNFSWELKALKVPSIFKSSQ